MSEAKRLRALEDENAKLKRLPADAMLDNAGLKDLLSKKWYRPLQSVNPWTKRHYCRWTTADRRGPAWASPLAV